MSSAYYRLACSQCDRDDFDGVSELPDDWNEIAEATQNPSGWWTHIGDCPDCQSGSASEVDEAS